MNTEEWIEVPEPEKLLSLTKTEKFDKAVLDAKEKELRSLIKMMSLEKQTLMGRKQFPLDGFSQKKS